MSDFVLVSLSSQREAVLRYVNGWPVEQVLDWMKQYGTVIEPDASHPRQIFVFESHTGIKDAFCFSEKDELVITVSGWLV